MGPPLEPMVLSGPLLDSASRPPAGLGSEGDLEGDYLVIGSNVKDYACLVGCVGEGEGS